VSAKSFKDLIVWQKSFKLAELIYRLTKQLPTSEKYGLSSQLQRASVSVVSNIAEGYERNNRGEYIQFLGIARASAAEVEAQLLLVQKIYNLDIETELALLTEVQKLLYVISNKLNPRP
jgi:four helix bundle protein